MYRIAILFSLVFLFSCGDDTSVVDDPSFVTSDIDLFWQVYDEFGPKLTEDILKKEYIDKGSDGLKDFEQRKKIALNIKRRLSNADYQQYYEAIRENTKDLGMVESKSLAAFEKLQRINANTKLYDVYFMIGGLSTGGTVANSGMLIGTELFALTKEISLESLDPWHQSVIKTKIFLPSIVVHELIHLQQDLDPQNDSFITLLEQSIKEGMADFVAHFLLPDDPFFNAGLHNFADPIEEEVWREFETRMSNNYQETEWLYTGEETSQGYPADMGYYVGYKILESYAATFDTSEDAIRAMLNEQDYNVIYERSNYASKF